MADVCPGCGGHDILGKKFGFGDVTLYEYCCKSCGLFEEKKSTDSDVGAWSSRWHTEDDEVDDGDDGDEDETVAPDLTAVLATHLPPEAALPDRYHAANVSYVDDGLRYAGVVTEKATRYFIVGARPVRLVPKPDGGLGVEAIDWETGEMVRATQYLSRVIHGDNEVDEVSEIEWHRAVAEIRERLKA